MVDPIADMLTQIRNAQMVSKDTVEVPFSQLKYGIAKILEQYGFIKKATFKGRKTKKTIEITLKYKDGTSAILDLQKVSKPGQRMYIGSKDIRNIKGGRGIAILSTSKGLMTNIEARKQKVGGEVLCQIW